MDRDPVGVSRHPAVPLHAAAADGELFNVTLILGDHPAGLDARRARAHGPRRRHAHGAGGVQQHLLHIADAQHAKEVEQRERLDALVRQLEDQNKSCWKRSACARRWSASRATT
jgi:hypothetical protein